MKKVKEWTGVTQEAMQQDLGAMFRGAIRASLEVFLEAELETLVGAAWYAREGGRRDHRNGTYVRQLLTGLGQTEVTIPRARTARPPSQVVGRYQRRTAELDALVTSAYVNGVSTRKAGDVTEALLGKRVSRSTVSRVTKRLEAAVEALQQAPIVGDHPYLYLDATFVDARWARKVENVSALVAYAVGPDGHRHLLAVTIGPEESEASWSELLQQLLERGLGGIRLVISDEHAGLLKALRRWLPEVPRQRCTVHLQRNVVAKVPKRLQARLAREVGTVFTAAGAAEAKQRLMAVTARWQKELPEAMACLAKGVAAATTFYQFPKAHWRRIRTTNSVERLHREIKRRTRAVGAFPDRASALRLITAVAIQVTTVWEDRRYIDVALFDTPVEQAA